MNSPPLPTTVLAATFFQRLQALESVTRIILGGARLSALLTFRGAPEKRVLLDFARSPARVTIDGPARGADISVAVDGEVMHDVLLGRVAPGLALGRRQMLLRGSAADLAKFIPMFDFGPLLYREHLADVGLDGFARPSGYAPLKEELMPEPTFRGDPIPLVKLAAWETVLFRVINALACAGGWLLGAVKHRLLRNLSLFDILTSLAKGVAASTPKLEQESHGPTNPAQR